MGNISSGEDCRYTLSYSGVISGEDPLQRRQDDHFQQRRDSGQGRERGGAGQRHHPAAGQVIPGSDWSTLIT